MLERMVYGFLSRNQDTFVFKFNVKFTPTYPAEQMFPSRNRVAAQFKSGLETSSTKIFSFYLRLESSAFPTQPLIFNFTPCWSICQDSMLFFNFFSDYARFLLKNWVFKIGR